MVAEQGDEAPIGLDLEAVEEVNELELVAAAVEDVADLNGGGGGGGGPAEGEGVDEGG